MGRFKLKSEYVPTGDQPQAIERLAEGLEKGYKYQTLLGVTGSGKTFSMAQIINRVQRPTLVMAPNKTLAGQLYSEFKEFFPRTRWSILSATMIITSRRPMCLRPTSTLKRTPRSTMR